MSLRDGNGERAPGKVQEAGPYCRAAISRKGDKHSSPHSITSSARASSEGGIVMPSTLAILILIIGSNLVVW